MYAYCSSDPFSRYVNELWRMISQGSIEPSINDYKQLAQVLLDNNDLGRLDIISRHMLMQFPDDETAWMMRLELIIAQKSSAELKQFLERIQKEPVYFSKANRDKIAFWQQKII